MAKIAVIDIGTNSIHMVLAEIQLDTGYKILDRFKDMTRLGNGAFTTHHLSDEAITRGLDVIRNLVTLAKNKGYDRIIAVATSAVREAKNGGDFIDLVANQTGLTVRVISGAEEASQEVCEGKVIYGDLHQPYLRAVFPIPEELHPKDRRRSKSALDRVRTRSNGLRSARWSGGCRRRATPRPVFSRFRSSCGFHYRVLQRKRESGPDVFAMHAIRVSEAR